MRKREKDTLSLSERDGVTQINISSYNNKSNMTKKHSTLDYTTPTPKSAAKFNNNLSYSGGGVFFNS